MNPEWIAVGVAGVSLVVSLVTLVVALRILGSARRSERAGDERLEILREQRERLELLREERQVLFDELKRVRAPMDETELRAHLLRRRGEIK